MNIKALMQNKKVMNAIYLGFLCSVSYLAVYFARNVLGTVTPKMLDAGYSEEYIGRVSSVYFIFYAVGQLINGAIGDKVKTRYMISVGLFMAGVTNFLFMHIVGDYPSVALFIYGMMGFFLAMIYGPMTKVIAENTEPVYATRCSLGYTFASFFGSPVAGVAASAFEWKSVFVISTVALTVMAVACFAVFLIFEKKGIVKYNQYVPKKKEGKTGGIKLLIEHRIIKFTIVSILTGVIRTTVVFCLPTYISQYLGFSSDKAALIFTAATFTISTNAFLSVYIYEKLRRNMDLTMFIMFIVSTVFFALLYIVKHPILNIGFIVLAIMGSNGAASMLWSRYCPSLRDTGMVSGATGFLDFVSYMAAALSSTLFANAVPAIGWGNVILIWLALMIIGVIITIPTKDTFKKTSRVNNI